MQKRRKKVLIDKTFQLSFLKFILAVLIIVCSCFSFFLIRINTYLTDYIMVSVEESARPATYVNSAAYLKTFKNQLQKKDMQFILEVYLAILIVGIMVSILAIRFTHRVAGPVYRFKKVIDSAIKGDYSVRITLRKHDYLKDLSDKLNELLASLEKKK